MPRDGRASGASAPGAGAQEHILQGLNPAQREAVTHDTGPLLIVAGAGTGKTTVITRRIAWLIAQGKARPEQILALTFTDKAAAEMEERVDTLVPYGYADVQISTFHAFGDRVLREHALEIGLTPDFRVLNRAEQVIFLRDRLFDPETPLVRYRPLGDPTRYLQALITLFSRCKDEDVTPEDYLAGARRLAAEANAPDRDEEAREYAEQQLELARTYAVYRDLAARAGAIDFGDQIVLALKLLRERAYVRGAYQRRFHYILVDEFQDTNYAQFQLVKLLAARRGNLTVVADDDQCLPPGTLVETPSGQRQIESIQPGDPVLTAVGKGRLARGVVTRVFKSRKEVRLLTFETESGRRVTVTDNHKMFCHVPRRVERRDTVYVYLMERRDLGWRIGVTSDLSVRLCLERGADRIVGLRGFPAEAEARYHEALWSLKYAIPTLPFKPRSDMMIVGEYLERLYGQLETRKSAERLAADLGIDLRAHHFALGGVHRGGQSRAKVILAMCYRRYVPKSGRGVLRAPQILHAVSLETSAPDVIERLRAGGFPLRRAKRGWLHRATTTSLREAGIRAELLCELADAILEVRFGVGRWNSKHLSALVMPAGNVLPGHYLPVAAGDRVVYERITRVGEHVRIDDVHDLEVDRTHNFIANGVVVHNSIYKFRGAAVSNVLGFLEAYRDTKRIVLNENYRSTQEILGAAYACIVKNNPDRLEFREGIDKQLVSRVASGCPPLLLRYGKAEEEADDVAQRIQANVEAGRWRHDDVAILVRSNDEADHFLRSLNMRGVPWTFSGNAGLYGRPEIRLLIAFLRAVAHPDDSISVHYLASSDLYQVPIVELTRCATYADRKHRWLFDVLRQMEGIPELASEASDGGRRAVAHVVADLTRYMELGREASTGALLYQFLMDSGWLARMSQAMTVRAEAEVQNVAKFFRRVQSASKALRYDSVREFVKHLDALIEAGEDPAVVEADVERRAVRVLTVHKAKGLEFPVVFLVALAQGKFPSRGRRETFELPDRLVRDVLPTGNFHVQEERRLFYVGVTRAKSELYLTYAEDYGGTRRLKMSQFVAEALGAGTPSSTITGGAMEVIGRSAPARRGDAEVVPPLGPDEELVISHKQIDDYQTCPLKYRYVHILRVPILRHHAVVYGNTIHKVVEHYLERRAVGNYTPLEELLSVYEREWENQGFLTWEHQEARKAAGREALTRFWNREEAEGVKPTHVEKEFGFSLGRNRVRGRFDRVDEDLLGATIIDYKTSDVTRQRDADRRAAESLQLKIYALAWREMTGVLPQRVELRFIDAHVAGQHVPTASDVEEAREAVAQTAAGIRARSLAATPSFRACRFCAYNQICPSTAASD